MTSRMKSVQRQRLWVHLSVKCCTSILCVTIRCFESIEGEQVTCVSSNFVWQNSWPLITCVCWESTRVGVIYSYWFLEIWFNLSFQSSPFNLPPTPSVVWHTVNRLPEVNCEQALMLLADWGCVCLMCKPRVRLVDCWVTYPFNIYFLEWCSPVLVEFQWVLFKKSQLELATTPVFLRWKPSSPSWGDYHSCLNPA